MTNTDSAVIAERLDDVYAQIGSLSTDVAGALEKRKQELELVVAEQQKLETLSKEIFALRKVFVKQWVTK